MHWSPSHSNKKQYPVITAHEVSRQAWLTGQPDLLTTSANRNLLQPTNDNKIRRKSNIKKTEKRFQDAAERAEKLEMLLPEESGYLEAEGMERTYKFRQEELAQNVDINTSKKVQSRYRCYCEYF